MRPNIRSVQKWIRYGKLHSGAKRGIHSRISYSLGLTAIEISDGVKLLIETKLTKLSFIVIHGVKIRALGLMTDDIKGLVMHLTLFFLCSDQV